MMAAGRGVSVLGQAGQTPFAVEGAGASGIPEIRVLEQTTSGLLLRFDAQWTRSLSADAAGLGAAADPAHVQRLIGGWMDRAAAEFDLPFVAAPSIEILSQESESVRPGLPPEAAALLAAAYPEDPVRVTSVGMSRRVPVAAVEAVGLSFEPETGELTRYRTILFRVRFASGAGAALGTSSNPHLDISRSVLADGSWFKVPIEEEGIYRVDRSVIAALGLNPASVDPANVRLYGNGGEPLPAIAGAVRPADLLENPSMVVGGGDGSFDAGDAVLFYAKGPRGWRYEVSEQRWAHYVHPFSNQTYQFLRVDAPGGRRVETGTSPGGQAERLDRFDARYFVENDLVNLGQSDNAGSGYDWLGDMVDAEFRRRKVLEVGDPGRVSGVVRFRSRVAARSNPAASIAFLHGEDVLARASLPVVFTGANTADSWSARDAVVSFERTFDAAGPIALELRLDGGNLDSRGWLDWLEVFYPRPFVAESGMLRFHTPAGRAGLFDMTLSGFSTAPEVWDVTDISDVRRVPADPTEGGFLVRVTATETRPRELVAFTTGSERIRTPSGGNPLPPQDLHGITATPQFAIITPEAFRESAERLAARRRDEGLDVVVTSIEEIYNEFSGGVPDMRAARDYLKFLYDRVPPSNDRSLRYALLFGDGHFDFRGLSDDDLSPLGPNLIFPFQTPETLFRQASYTSDDYFGLLDDHEGVWEWPGYAGRTNEVLDIGIGRLTAQTPAEAQLVVDKIFRYESAAAQGAWRTRYTFVADDGPAGSRNDLDLHTQNADIVAQEVRTRFPEVSLDKIYALSYPVETTAVGRRIPAAKSDLMAALQEGTLLWNYSGHGGWEGLADEKLFMLEDIDELDNGDRLTVFVTATCSFGAFDRAREQSGAERLLVHPRGGAVALLTTVRLVVTWDNPNAYNLGLNLELNRHLLSRDSQGNPLRLGDAMLRTKTTAVGMQGNNRKFNLLGDPTMRLALPTRRVVVTTVNGKELGTAPAQLRALERAEIEGRILQPDGLPDPLFNGTVEVSVFDAQRTVPIPEDLRRHLPGGSYDLQKDLIYRGMVSARSGQFKASFVVPRDISYSGDRGRIALYAASQSEDGLGATTNIVVGGTASEPIVDTKGPEIQLFLNDTTFVSGGTTGGSPMLLARLFDESGINTVGTGVGHELLLVIDGDEAGAIELGSRFEGSLDSYQSGEVRYPLSDLSPGSHTVRLRAWDVLNNSHAEEVFFFVIPEEKLALRNLFNYPNPMRGGSPTRFVFEHNQPAGTPARVELRVYTVSGQMIRAMRDHDTLPLGVLPTGTVLIPYDGMDENMDPLSRGIYLYKLRVEIEPEGREKQIVEQIGKLAVIR